MFFAYSVIIHVLSVQRDMLTTGIEKETGTGYSGFSSVRQRFFRKLIFQKQNLNFSEYIH